MNIEAFLNTMEPLHIAAMIGLVLVGVGVLAYVCVPKAAQGPLTKAPLTKAVPSLPTQSSTDAAPVPEHDGRAAQSAPHLVVAPPAQDWVHMLKQSLQKTRTLITDHLGQMLSNRALDTQALEELHELLYRADIGVETSDKLITHLKAAIQSWSGEDLQNKDKVLACLHQKSLDILGSSEVFLEDTYPTPAVVLMVGVNGVGKTTTTAKLAAYYKAQGKHVLLCAADTFRAAAIEQLKIWGERLGIPVIAHQQGSDPSAVVFDALQGAQARKADILFIDTAGRLHNKQNLMDELSKIRRTIDKQCPQSHVRAVLVLDGTTGQNALQQAQAFKELVSLNSMIVTKLDGTAKGGFILALRDKHKLPLHFIGLGERVEDLRPFDPKAFGDSLFLN